MTPGARRGEIGVAEAFGSVPLHGEHLEIARSCVDAVRRITGGSVRLSLPLSVMPIVAGDELPDAPPTIRFPGPDGPGQLWLSATSAELGDDTRCALAEQFARVWRVLDERLTHAAELDRLRFHLGALQQVARTLAAVRAAEETERLVLDSVGEVFFAWWAALYRRDGKEYLCRAVRSLRGESVAYAIPTRAVMSIAPPGAPPAIPSADSEIREHVPAEIAAVAPLELGEEEAGLLILGRRMTDAPYDTHDLALLRALADSSAVALRNADLLDRLREQATMDPLTGCHNRRGFDEFIALEFARAKRYQRPLTLLLLDIDHFKRVNDELGHDVGDRALQRIGRTVRHAFRTTDSACRYGGEEFAVIFPETPKDEGRRLAEKLRAMVEDLPANEEVPRPLTASVGVASFPEDAEDAEELIRAADRALYRAKASGRNQVMSAEP